MRKEIILFFVLAMLLLSSCTDGKKIINGTTSAGNGSANASAPGQPEPDAGANQTNNTETPAVNGTNATAGNGTPDLTHVIINKNETEANETAEENDANMTGLFGKLEVGFIDVGYGESIFIMTPHNGTLIIDGGDDHAGPKITQHLRKRSIYSAINAVIATNLNDNRIGGLDSILFNLGEVQETYTNGQNSTEQSYLSVYQMGNAKGMFVPVTKDNSVMIDDDVAILLMTPYKDGYFNNSYSNSIVIKLMYKDVKFLFMSDCDLQCEAKLEGYDLKADVMSVAKHGAKDATSDKLLDMVDPKVAVISVGDNDDGNPDPETLQRLEKRGITVLRTDLNGTIIFTSADGKDYSISTEQ